MFTSGRPITLLLLCLLGSATSSPVSIHTPAPPLPSQILHPSTTVLPSPPSPTVLPSPPSPTLSVSEVGCPLTMSPSALVVRFGDPVAANCSTTGFAPLGWEVELAAPELTMDRSLVWRVDRMTKWSITPSCYVFSEEGGQCHIHLPLTVYKPPDNVFFSVVNHTGPMIEGHQYTLQCAVQDVAPVENLIVTFYRGPTALGRLQPNNNAEKTPVTENFTLNITSSKEDDGVQYWCEAKLELGPEGPQQPPVVTSHKLTATVYYQPHLHGSPHPDPIIIPEGNPLQLNCSAVGNPRPSFNWTLPSDNPSPSNLSVLTINSVTSADNGLYTCCVSNNMGTHAVRFNVEVQANHIPIILGAIAVAVAVILILAGVGYHRFHRHNRTRQVFYFQNQHSAVPTVE